MISPIFLGNNQKLLKTFPFFAMTKTIKVQKDQLKLGNFVKEENKTK